MIINGKIKLSGDKSISHRALMIASISKGVSRISNLCNSQDVLSTINCLKSCKADIVQDGQDYLVKSSSLSKPLNPLNCRNSGTTIRLMAGLLAGQGVDAELYGDRSLMSRPMDRIIKPLNQMGVDIKFKDKKIVLKKSNISPTSIKNKIPSAQVKSSIILAALGSRGKISLHESYNTRDHTERMLQFISRNSIDINDNKIVVKKGFLNSENFIIPADISKASFIIACACLAPNSNLIIEDVLFNPGRTGFIDSLNKMGADIKIYNKKVRHNEPVVDIKVKYAGQLKNIHISSSKIPSMIDEIPILSVIGALSKGVMKISGLKELRFKESDRISSILYNLKSMGADIISKEDSLMIKGRKYLYNTNIKTFYDHRIAMAFYVASLFSKRKAILDDIKCIDISFPDFFNKIKEISV